MPATHEHFLVNGQILSQNRQLNIIKMQKFPHKPLGLYGIVISSVHKFDV